MLYQFNNKVREYITDAELENFFKVTTTINKLMLLYIVKHATFSNENVIFTDEVSAINYIEKRIIEQIGN